MSYPQTNFLNHELVLNGITASMVKIMAQNYYNKAVQNVEPIYKMLHQQDPTSTTSPFLPAESNVAYFGKFDNFVSRHVDWSASMNIYDYIQNPLNPLVPVVYDYVEEVFVNASTNIDEGARRDQYRKVEHVLFFDKCDVTGGINSGNFSFCGFKIYFA